MSQQSTLYMQQLQQQLQLEFASKAPSQNSSATANTAAQRRRRGSSIVGGLLAPSSAMSMIQGQGISKPQRVHSQHMPFSQPMRHTLSSRSESAMSSLPIRPMATSSESLQVPRESLPSHHLSGLLENGGLRDPGIGIDPDKFINDFNFGSSYLSSTGTNFSSFDIYPSLGPSAPPSMISASSAPEAAYPMTRDNSAYGNISAPNMARAVSIRSQDPDNVLGQYVLGPSALEGSAYTGSKGSGPNSDLFAIGTSLDTLALQPFPAYGNPHLIPPPMERIESTSSNRSTTSKGNRRAKEALQQAVLRGSRSVIQPKPSGDTGGSSPLEVSRRKERSSVSSRHRYQRPTHPRVYCGQCDEHPKGFRGDHEHRRHVQAKHEGVVKKYICRDPAEAGILSDLTALHPLSKCKACSTKKQYGAYYNAAAHLRRTHFRPKPARGKNKVPLSERRGGKGGGDDPPMNKLKAWFQEIHVQVDQSGALDDAEQDDIDEDSPSADAGMTHMCNDGLFSNMADSAMPQLDFEVYGMSCERNFSQHSGFTTPGSSMISPLTAVSSSSFDLGLGVGPSSADLNMLPGTDGNTFNMSVGFGNDSMSPAYEPMNNLRLSDQDFEEEGDTARNIRLSQF